MGGFGEKDAILRQHAVLDQEHPLENDITIATESEYNWYRAGHSCVFLSNESCMLTVGGFMGEKRKLVLDAHKKWI